MFIPSFNKLCILVGTHGYLFCVLFYNLNLNYLFCCSNGSSFGLHKFFHLTLYPVDIPHPFAYWAYDFRFPPHILILQDQFSSVAQSCRTLCDPMNRSTQGPLVHHQLPEFTQTHVHRVSDTIQPPHLLLSPLLLPPIPPSIRIFSNESTLHMRWPNYWNFSFSIIPSKEIPGLIFRINWMDLLAVQGTLKSLLQHHSSKASILRCSAFFTVQLSHPYMTTGKTIALTRRTFVGKVMSLLFIMLSRLVITFLPRSKHLLIS